MILGRKRTSRGRILSSVATLARLALVSLAAALGMALVGWYPTTGLGGSDAGGAMLAGLGVALVGGWVGLSIPVAFLGGSARALAWGSIGGLAARFFVTLTLALAVRKLSALPVKPLMLWVGMAQFVILAVDMVGLVRTVRATRAVEAA